MDFKEELKQYAQIVNNELKKHLNKEECFERILNESVEYSLMAGGKRLRPILTIVTYKLFREDYEKCFSFAIAMEMIHNFSLIHDDLPAIDNDDFRHGILTNHKKYNESTAILAGDMLFNKAYKVISEELMITSKEEMPKKALAFSELTHYTERMIVGEYVDTECEGKKISNESLEYIHNNKTAALIKCSIRMGAILAGATEKEIELLTKYADKIGLAFQIKDDILSEIGDEKVLGKPVGNDKEKEKCTFVTMYGLEKSKELLNNITKEAVNIISEYGEKAEFLKELALYIESRNK